MSETPKPNTEGADEATPATGTAQQEVPSTSTDQKKAADSDAGDAVGDEESKGTMDDEVTKGEFTYVAI